jgi:putative transposase
VIDYVTKYCLAVTIGSTSRAQDAVACLHAAIAEAERVTVVTDNGPCFRGGIYAEVFHGEDPLLRHVRTRVRSSQTNGVVERFFGSLKYEHLYRADIDDGDALAVEVHRFRHLYNTIRPHQALADRTPAQVYAAPGGGPGLVSA